MKKGISFWMVGFIFFFVATTSQGGFGRVVIVGESMGPVRSPAKVPPVVRIKTESGVILVPQNSITSRNKKKKKRTPVRAVLTLEELLRVNPSLR